MIAELLYAFNSCWNSLLQHGPSPSVVWRKCSLSHNSALCEPGQPNYYIAVHWHALELHLTRPWPLAAVSGAHRVNIPWSGSRSWARPPLFGAATKVTDSRLSCLGCAEPRPGQDPLWRWMGPDIGETGDISDDGDSGVKRRRQPQLWHHVCIWHRLDNAQVLFSSFKINDFKILDFQELSGGGLVKS